MWALFWDFELELFKFPRFNYLWLVGLEFYFAIISLGDPLLFGGSVPTLFLFYGGGTEVFLDLFLEAA